MTLLTIGQLAKQAGVRTSALRYYEDEGLLTPTERSAAGYRLYDHKAEQTLYFIQRAQRLGFSLDNIRTLLAGRQANNLSDEAIIQTAEARYLALERQITPLLVMRHELQLFLQDMTNPQQQQNPTQPHLEQLIERICGNPVTQPVETMLNWLLERTNCRLVSHRGQDLLAQLQGQHVHIWQAEQVYHILIVSEDPFIGELLRELTQLEADCQAHAHSHQLPELMHNEEGYLFVARGQYGFIFARLFLEVSN